MTEAEGGAWLDGLLRGRAAERDRLLVFPSQAVADAWAEAAPRRFDLGAVENDRFIGWDRFKELALGAHRKEKPADRLARTIWAAGIVARQKKKPFLSRMAGSGEPTPAFVPFFAGLPPGLDRAARSLRSSRSASRDEALEDLVVLRDDYAAFLAAHGLYEPAWETVGALPPGIRCSIIAPELIEDFLSYEARLEGRAPELEILRLPPLGGMRPALYSFDNSYEELRWTFLEAGRMLDSGARPEDIVVTVPGLEANADLVERAARIAGVPVAIKGGSNLASSPYGRLLREAGAAASAGFDFDAFRALLLDRFAAWKSPEAADDLIRFGIDYHAYASYTQGGKRVDVWEETFARAGGSPDLKAFYRRLAGSLRALVSAPDFARLRTAIFAFRSTFLDESGWMPAEERQVERCVAELEGLARTEAELGAAGSLDSPFSLYLAHLEGTTYVAQGGRSAAAIAVYPYRVSALHPARRHFVLQAGQDGIRVGYSALPFLREDQKAALGEADSDASADFALAYSISGETSFSYASESLSGWSVPHPFFTPPGGAARVGPPQGFESLRETCPLRAEEASWRGDSALPGRLLAFQSEAFEKALPGLAPPASRFDRDRASAESLSRLARRIRDGEGRLRLSATHLREYLACPFAWLLARGLRLEAAESGVGFFDALLAGNMAHEALRRLLGEMGRLGPLETRHLEAYRASAEAAVDEVLPFFEVKEGPFLAPMFAAYAPLLKDRLLRLVEWLVRRPGWEAGELEVEFERPYPELGLVLAGRMDRLAKRADGDGRAIVDYKKKHLPTKKDFFVDQNDGGLGDFQIAAYLALAEHAGLEVEEASFWSIELAKSLPVIGGEAERKRDDYGQELEAFDAALREVGGRIGAGDFGMTRDGEGACKNCDWKPVCRARWATE
jgi:hypothetical protein